MKSKFPVLTAGTYDPAGVGGFGSLIPMLSSFSSIMIMMLNLGLILVFRTNSMSFFDLQ